MYARPSNKEIGRLLKEAKARRWEITGGGSRHYQLRCPNPCKCSMTVASSTVNQISFTRCRTQLTNRTCWQPTPAQKGARP